MTDAKTIDAALLRRFVPLNSLSETHVNDILRRASVRELPRGRILFKRDAPNDTLHFLIDGAVDLADASFAIRNVEAGTPGAAPALDTADPHAFTGVTTGDVRVLELEKDYLDLVLTWNQAGNYVVTEIAREEDVMEEDWMSCLLQSHIFASIPPANIQKLFARFEPVSFSAGDVVVRQGEPGDYFYAIKSGVAQIQRRMSRDGVMTDAILAELRTGDVFGEDALIGNAPRNATVVMQTAGELMRLGQEDFQALLSDPVLREIRYEELERRMQDPAQRIELLDVRLPLEFRQGHIPGSRSMPLHGMRKAVLDLDPDTLYVTTCDGGRRAPLASYILSESGFESLVLVDPPSAPARAS